MPGQWERFKQSSIAKIVIGYSLVVWVLIQLIEAVLPTFETPLWVAQTLTFLLILGFPIALLVGWAYEKLPAQSSDIDGVESELQPAHSTPKKTLVLIGIGSCAVIGLFGFYMMPFIFDQSRFDDTDSLSSNTEISVPSRSFRSSLMLGETGRRAVHNTRSDIAITSDSLRLAYTESGTGGQRIYIKDLTQPNVIREIGQVDGAGGSGLLHFSEDNEWLHFIAGGSLSRVRIEGGSIQNINSEITVLRSGYASFDDRVIFSNASDGKLYSMSVSGGAPSLLQSMESNTDDNTKFYTWPRRLPDLQKILTTSSSSELTVGLGDIELHDLETGQVTTLIQSAANATYVESGHIVFMRDSDLWAVPFNIETLEIEGSQTPIIEGIEYNSSYGHAAYSVAADGRLFYLPGEDVGATLNAAQMTWVDRDGNSVAREMEPGSVAHLRLSPSEDQVAFTRYEENGSSDIYLWEFDRKILGRRTFGGMASRPIWSKDGDYLIYAHATEGLKSVAANGTESPAIIFPTSERVQAYAITADSTLIFDRGTPPRVYTLSLVDGTSSQLETAASELDLAPVLPIYHGITLSPNEHWVAYVSNETGLAQVYVRPFPNINGGKWQASTQGGFGPIWSKENTDIFFNITPNQQWSVSYEEGGFDSGRKPSIINLASPLQMFERRTTLSPATQPIWGYSSSRKEFLVAELPNAAAEVDQRILASQTNLVVVDNIFSELDNFVRRQTN